jgi:hypothetical protein
LDSPKSSKSSSGKRTTRAFVKHQTTGSGKEKVVSNNPMFHQVGLLLIVPRKSSFLLKEEIQTRLVEKRNQTLQRNLHLHCIITIIGDTNIEINARRKQQEKSFELDITPVIYRNHG